MPRDKRIERARYFIPLVGLDGLENRWQSAPMRGSAASAGSSVSSEPSAPQSDGGSKPQPVHILRLSGSIRKQMNAAAGPATGLAVVTPTP
jgi:hypothetical protein